MYFYDFLFNNSPKIAYETHIRNFSDYKKVKQDDIKFALGFYNFTGGPPKPILVKPYNYSFIQSTKGVYPEKPEKPIGKIVNCSQYKDDEKFNGINEELSLPKLETCSMLDESGTEIGGNIITTKKESQIEISQLFSLCEILGKKENCEIKPHFFKTIKILFFYKNSFIQKHLPKGYTYTYLALHSDINYKMDKIIHLKAKRAYISTDRNWIFDIFPHEEEEIFKIDATQTFEDSNLFSKEGEEKFLNIKINIELDLNVENYERSYTKLDDLMAAVGAIVALVEFFTVFTAEFFTEGNLEHSLYKEIYFTKNKLKEKNFNFLDYVYKLKKNNDNNNDNDNNDNNNNNDNNDNQIINNNNKQNIELENKIPDKRERNNSNNLSIRSNKELKDIQNENQKGEILNLNKTLNETKKYEEIANKQRNFLKENLIKKSKLVKIYQIFFPKKINDTNIGRLINIQGFIEKELDILNILKKLIEYENFKSLFLSENQNTLLSLLQRRIINKNIIDDEADDFHEKFFFGNSLNDNIRILKAFDEYVVNMESQNELTNKIIERLNNAYDI